MNSLEQTGKQLVEIWKQLGLNQRISLVMATLVVVAGLGTLVFWSSQTDYALLYGKLPETEAGKVVAALDESKIPYRLSGGGGTIMVPADKVHQVRMQLASKGIPRGDGVGFEIFDKPSFGISDFIQRANYLRAVQGELSRTISQVDSIDSARVMIVMPENRLLVDQQKKSTASVFVRVRGNAQLPPQTVNAIRFLVANAVEGLQPSQVSVVDNLGNVLSENTENDSLVGMTTTQLTARKNLEQYLSRRTEEMLATVLGPGQAVVRVAAEINFDTGTRTEEKFDPDVQVTRSSIIDDENTETTTPVPGGVVGMADPGESETNSAAVASTTSNTTKKKTVNNQYELNKTISSEVQAAGGIKRLSAAVFIAARTEGTGTDRKVLPRTPEEIEKLRRIVQSALGIHDSDPLRKDQITLEEMPFNDQPAMEIAQRLEKQERQEFWWSLAGRTVYPLLAVFALGALWMMFKRAPAEAIPLGVPVGSIGQNGKLNGHTNGHGTPGVTVEVLNQLIRENPDNMTQAIRSWMTRGKDLS